MTWILTNSGQRVDLLEPDPASINIRDIAWHLSGIVRYTGAASRSLTVLEHSIYVWQLVKKMGGGIDAQIWGLMHDAHEAYMGDVSTPMKKALSAVADGGSDVVADIDWRLVRSIQTALALPALTLEIGDVVRKADHWAMAFERHALLPYHSDWAFDLSQAPARIIVPKQVPMIPRPALSQAFVELFSQMMEKRQIIDAVAPEQPAVLQ